MDSIDLYFFSAFAQVWAALVAFGGLLLRDRSERYKESMDEYLESIKNKLEAQRTWVNEHSQDFSVWVTTTSNRSDLENFMDSNLNYRGDWKLPDNGEVQVPNLIIAATQDYSWYRDREDKRNRIDKVLVKLIVLGGTLILSSLGAILLLSVLKQCPTILWFIKVALMISSLVGFWFVFKGVASDETKPKPTILDDARQLEPK